MNYKPTPALSPLLFQAIDAAKDIIIITEASPLDPPGPRIVYVNKAFEKLTEYTQSEVIGQTPRILQGKKTSAEILARVGEKLRKHEPVHETLINYSKSGKSYSLDMSIVPLYDEQNRISHFAAIERDVSQIKKMEAKLIKLATIDQLTNILNRGTFFQVAEHHFSLFLRDKTPFTLLMIDIDNFKKINDQQGHIAGDNILKWLGQHLKNTFRKIDIIGRYGGEEFIILLPQSTLKTAKEKALKLKENIDTSLVPSIENTRIHLTVSLGVVEVSTYDHSLMELVSRVDNLLYKAKNKGKNCVVWDANDTNPV